jgi:hypothetical protein
MFHNENMHVNVHHFGVDGIYICILKQINHHGKSIF